MKTYILTSEKFTGEVLFVFDEHDIIVKMDSTGAKMDKAQSQWLSDYLPKTLQELKELLKRMKAATLKLQQNVDVTFEMFWIKYDEKLRSSKKKSLTIWNKLPQIQRDMAYNFIPTYERSIPSGVAKKYAETYLRAELWNN